MAWNMEQMTFATENSEYFPAHNNPAFGSLPTLSSSSLPPPLFLLLSSSYPLPPTLFLWKTKTPFRPLRNNSSPFHPPTSSTNEAHQPQYADIRLPHRLAAVKTAQNTAEAMKASAGALKAEMGNIDIGEIEDTADDIAGHIHTHHIHALNDE